MPEIPNPDTVIPLGIIGICVFLMLVTWLFTRRKAEPGALAPTVTSEQPIVGQAQVTQAQLGMWHRTHGPSVQHWIENHEDVLTQVSDDGLSINLDQELTASHDELGPAIDLAVEQHPSPQMRAQLSALVVASRATIEGLKRSNWTHAEKQHLAYLEYRDVWLDRLRQFATAESDVDQLRTITTASVAPGWLHREESNPG